MGDLKSPKIIQLKAALFVLLAVMSGGLLTLAVWPHLTWSMVVFYLFSLWATCRAYYFCFYVIEHYVDSDFRYSGLLDLSLYLLGWKRRTP